MLRKLVICGLLAGLCGGLLAAGFGEVAGEPAVEDAIAFESSHAHGTGHSHGGVVVSRGVQSGPGMFTAVIVIGVSMGGLFALLFAAAYGRVAQASPARTAAWLAAAAFVVVALVPFLKYPAAPPGVGGPDTIGERTLVYVTMIAISVCAALAGLRVRSALGGRSAGARGVVAGLAVYALVALAAGLAMPVVDEVPADFPAATLWNFRLASLGMHAVLWSGLGAVFAVTASRVMAGRPILEWRRSRVNMEST